MNTDQAQLHALLARSDHYPTVKIRVEAEKWLKISLAAARELIANGRYAWSGTKQRVKQIALIALHVVDPARKVLPWRACMRTRESPSLMPSIEWIWSVNGKPQWALAA